MQANLETIGNIERRLNITLPAEDVDSEVSTRLKKLAQTVKMHGFRPGKVPLKVVAQQYGSQVRQEVLADKLQKIFGDAVRDNNLRVAGYPKFETRPGDEGGEKSAGDLATVFDVPVNISAVLGKSHMTVAQLLKLNRGSVLELDRIALSPRCSPARPRAPGPARPACRCG